MNEIKKVTLVTGATSGLGKEISKLYAIDNNNLLIVGQNEEKLVISKREILELNPNITVDYVCADLSLKSGLEKVYDYCVNNNYFVNNLVNNAGFGDRSDFKDMDIDLQMKMTEVNCNAPLYFMRKFVTDMIKYNEGHIINVASIAGIYPGPYMCTYHSTKSYLLNISQAISYELRNTNIKVLALCPGPFKSDFVGKAHNDWTFKKIKPLEASRVAKIAYNASLKGKRMYIVGMGNRFTDFISRFVPRGFILKTSSSTIKDPKEK